MSEPILVQRNDHIATVVLNRPDYLNAVNKRMWEMMITVFETLSADDSLRCIIVRGAGEKSFSPGCDIAEFEAVRSNSAQAVEYGRLMHAASAALENCPHPLVAQIHGVCVGGGLEIASFCDIRICGESSKFGVPIKNLGLVMAYPEILPIIRLVGRAVAMEILLEGRIFDAMEAKDKGLVTRIVPDGMVEQEAIASANRIAEGAPLVARWHKKFARRLTDPAPITPEEYAECFACFDTEDYNIGFRNFLSRQKPRFVGK